MRLTNVIARVLAACAGLLFATAALAQSPGYPDRPVKIIVPFAAASTRAITLVNLMGAPLAVSGVMAGIRVSLSRDGKEVDPANKPGHNLDGSLSVAD